METFASLDTNRAHYGVVHPRVALTLDHLGAIYRQQKRNTEAVDMFTQSLAIIEEITQKKEVAKTTPPAKPAVAGQQNEKESDGLNLSDRGTAEGEGNDEEDLIDLSTAQNNLGLMYYQLGDYSKAEALFESAVRKLKQREKESEEPAASVMQKNLAICLFKQGKLEQSEHELKGLVDHLLEVVGLHEHDAPVIDAFRHLARVYALMDKPEQSSFYADKVARSEERELRGQ